MWGLTLTAPKWKWKAQNKGTAYPYICVSDCDIGYIWQREARKCIKIVRKTAEKTKYSDAAVACAKEDGRLLSLETCDQFVGLQNDLWTQYPDLSDRYWLGYYAEGVGLYTGARRISPDDATMFGPSGRKSVLPGGAKNNCAGDKHSKVVMVDSSDNTITSIAANPNGFFSELVFTQEKEAKLMLQTFQKVDSTINQNYLCEKEREWTCREGSIMFQEHCYTFVEEEAPLAWADKVCLDLGGKVAEIETRMHMNFIDSWLVMENFTYSHAWLGLKLKSASLSDLTYRGYEETSAPFDWTAAGLDFASSASSSAVDPECVALLKADNNLWTKRSCHDNSSYICQTGQIASGARLETIYRPLLILPLDPSLGLADYLNPRRVVTESLVAITEHSITGSNLLGAAHFLGSHASFIEVDNSGDFETPVSFGLAVSMWVKVEDIQDGERQWLFDATGSCSDGSEKDHSFMLFLERSASVASPASATFDLSDTCLDLVSGNASSGTPVVSGSILKLVAVLCDGPADGAGSCSMFTSSESVTLQQNVWNYLGFVFDGFNKSGTFIINDTFGYHDFVDGRARMSEYFTYDTKNWLLTDAMKGPIRIGSRKFQVADTAKESLAGKISCVQFHEGALTPSQMYHQKNCPLKESYEGKYSDCPFGYQHYRGHCYLLSLKENTFSEAEYDCVSRSGQPPSATLSSPCFQAASTPPG